MFSVIIPYYKKRKYIERCIDAVLAQTYQDFEIILVDDGSQDDVAQLIEEKYSGKVHLIQQENQGVSAARNTGIAAATHDYIAFLDADDYWSPFYLACNAEIINNETDVKIIGSHYTRNRSELQEIYKAIEFNKLTNYFVNAVPNTIFFTSATIVNRCFFKNNSGFNTSLKYGEDLDVWFRTILDGGNAFFIGNTLVYYSNEDEQQATNVSANLSDTLSAHILDLYQPYLKDAVFKKFISKLLYMSLYRAYFREDNHLLAASIIKKIPHKLLLAELYYAVPYNINNKIIATKTGRRYARNYMKLLFRYIYK